MIVALLITLTGTAFTGWMMADPTRQALLPDLPQIITTAQTDEDDGEYGEDGEREDPLEELNEVFANLMLLLVALHLAGVAIASFRHRENLARAMIASRKRAPDPGDIA